MRCVRRLFHLITLLDANMVYPNNPITRIQKQKTVKFIGAQILYENGVLFGFVDEILIDQDGGSIDYIIGRRVDGERRIIPWGLIRVRGCTFRLRVAAA